MTAINYNESINIEREKANLLCLVKLTLNALVDQSLSAISTSVLDERNSDVTNFIITIERILCFRMRASWLSDRRYFWEFIRPACIGSCRQSIIERVEEVSNANSLKEKGRIWIKFALMEKKLSELLKLVISDCHLVQKFYYEDSIMISSQAFILCDQLAALNTVDFSFCFKQDIPTQLLNDNEINTIDLTPFLSFKSKEHQELLKNQNDDDETKQSSPNPTTVNDFNALNRIACKMVSLERYKLEVEQRKYFEELLRHRDHELQQLRVRFNTLKSERDSEVIQLENIILELQLELLTARGELEFKNKRFQQLNSTQSLNNLPHSDSQKISSTSTSITNRQEASDKHIVSSQISLSSSDDQIESLTMDNLNEKTSIDFVDFSSQCSSHSVTTIQADTDQYEIIQQVAPNNYNDSNEIAAIAKSKSSSQVLSSATSIPTPSSSNDNDEQPKQSIEDITKA